MRQEEEIGLIGKAKEGDTVAFAAMIRRYQNLVYATAPSAPMQQRHLKPESPK